MHSVPQFTLIIESNGSRGVVVRRPTVGAFSSRFPFNSGFLSSSLYIIPIQRTQYVGARNLWGFCFGFGFGMDGARDECVYAEMCIAYGRFVIAFEFHMNRPMCNLSNGQHKLFVIGFLGSRKSQLVTASWPITIFQFQCTIGD